MTALVDALRSSAQEYTRTAIRAAFGHNDRAFALAAGVALEHLAKARLAMENAALIGADFASMLALTRHADDLGRLGAVRTIGAGEAFKRLREADPTLLEPSGRVDDVLRLRNHEAHLALVNGSVDDAVVGGFVRVVASIVGPDDVDWFFGEHAAWAAATLSAVAESIDADVHRRVAIARRGYADQFERLDEEAREELLAYLGRQRDLDLDFERELHVDCPVCAGPAISGRRSALPGGVLRAVDGVLRLQPRATGSDGDPDRGRPRGVAAQEPARRDPARPRIVRRATSGDRPRAAAHTTRGHRR